MNAHNTFLFWWFQTRLLSLDRSLSSRLWLPDWCSICRHPQWDRASATTIQTRPRQENLADCLYSPMSKRLVRHNRQPVRSWIDNWEFVFRLKACPDSVQPAVYDCFVQTLMSLVLAATKIIAVCQELYVTIFKLYYFINIEF